MTLVVTTTDDLAACLKLREQVFIQEQNVPPGIERDHHDATATHILAELNGTPVGCARVVQIDSIAKIGRVCALPEYRGQGIGAALTLTAIDAAHAMNGVTMAKLNAQAQAIDFYAKLGFVAKGEIFLEAGIEHQEMALTL